MVRKWETNNCPEGEKKIWYDIFKGGIKPQYKILSECSMCQLKKEKEKWEGVYYKKNVEDPAPAPATQTEPNTAPATQTEVQVNDSDSYIEINPHISKYLITESNTDGEVIQSDVAKPKPLSKDDAKKLRLKEAVNCLRNYYHKKYQDVSSSEVKVSNIEAEPVPVVENNTKIGKQERSRLNMLELENKEYKEEVETLKTQLNGLLGKLYRSNMISFNF